MTAYRIDSHTEPYDTIAAIYDRWQYSFRNPFHRIVQRLLKKELRRYRLRRGTFIDCACGTGDAAVYMARQGWETAGVDSAQQMLEIARRKAADAGKEIELVHQRLEDMSVGRTFMVAGSFYDSLNHIVDKRRLGKALRRIRAHLEPGGLFLFDSNTLNCFRSLWTTTSTGHEDNYTLIIENRYDESVRQAESDVTIFERMNDGLYRKSGVRVRERWYADDEFEVLLQRAGFTILRREPIHLLSYDEAEPYKQWWVCRAD
jgi:ubiquinone/menaquinone biosynthesis C-methylase UbiE